MRKARLAINFLLINFAWPRGKKPFVYTKVQAMLHRIAQVTTIRKLVCGELKTTRVRVLHVFGCINNKHNRRPHATRKTFRCALHAMQMMANNIVRYARKKKTAR